MLKDYLAGYYQKNKERLQKRTPERYQDLHEEEEEKWEYDHKQYKNLSKQEKENKLWYGCKRYKISQKMKNKSQLSIEKIILKCLKMPILKILVTTQIKKRLQGMHQECGISVCLKMKKNKMMNF